MKWIKVPTKEDRHGPESEKLDPLNVRIGEKLRVVREADRLTQVQLTRAAGVTFQQVQKYERGVNRIAAAQLWRIWNDAGCPS